MTFYESGKGVRLMTNSQHPGDTARPGLDSSGRVGKTELALSDEAAKVLDAYLQDAHGLGVWVRS